MAAPSELQPPGLLAKVAGFIPKRERVQPTGLPANTNATPSNASSSTSTSAHTVVPPSPVVVGPAASSSASSAASITVTLLSHLVGRQRGGGLSRAAAEFGGRLRPLNVASSLRYLLAHPPASEACDEDAAHEPESGLPDDAAHWARCAVAVYTSRDRELLRALGPSFDRADVLYAQLRTQDLLPAHVILRDRSQRVLLLVIRGTASLTDLITDLTGCVVNALDGAPVDSGAGGNIASSVATAAGDVDATGANNAPTTDNEAADGTGSDGVTSAAGHQQPSTSGALHHSSDAFVFGAHAGMAACCDTFMSGAYRDTVAATMLSEHVIARINDDSDKAGGRSRSRSRSRSKSRRRNARVSSDRISASDGAGIQLDRHTQDGDGPPTGAPAASASAPSPSDPFSSGGGPPLPPMSPLHAPSETVPPAAASATAKKQPLRPLAHGAAELLQEAEGRFGLSGVGALLYAFKALCLSYADWPLVIVGHSLGAAVAALLAARLRIALAPVYCDNIEVGADAGKALSDASSGAVAATTTEAGAASAPPNATTREHPLVTLASSPAPVFAFIFACPACVTPEVGALMCLPRHQLQRLLPARKSNRDTAATDSKSDAAVRGWTSAAAAVLGTSDGAFSSRPMVTTIVIGDDFVPRLTIASLRVLHDRLAHPELVAAANQAALADIKATAGAVATAVQDRVSGLGQLIRSNISTLGSEALGAAPALAVVGQGVAAVAAKAAPAGEMIASAGAFLRSKLGPAQKAALSAVDGSHGLLAGKAPLTLLSAATVSDGTSSNAGASIPAITVDSLAPGILNNATGTAAGAAALAAHVVTSASHAVTSAGAGLSKVTAVASATISSSASGGSGVLSGIGARVGASRAGKGLTAIGGIISAAAAGGASSVRNYSTSAGNAAPISTPMVNSGDSADSDGLYPSADSGGDAESAVSVAAHSAIIIENGGPAAGGNASITAESVDSRRLELGQESGKNQPPSLAIDDADADDDDTNDEAMMMLNGADVGAEEVEGDDDDGEGEDDIVIDGVGGSDGLRDRMMMMSPLSRLSSLSSIGRGGSAEYANGGGGGASGPLSSHAAFLTAVGHHDAFPVHNASTASTENNNGAGHGAAPTAADGSPTLLSPASSAGASGGLPTSSTAASSASSKRGAVVAAPGEVLSALMLAFASTQCLLSQALIVPGTIYHITRMSTGSSSSSSCTPSARSTTAGTTSASTAANVSSATAPSTPPRVPPLSVAPAASPAAAAAVATVHGAHSNVVSSASSTPPASPRITALRSEFPPLATGSISPRTAGSGGGGSGVEAVPPLAPVSPRLTRAAAVSVYSPKTERAVQRALEETLGSVASSGALTSGDVVTSEGSALAASLPAAASFGDGFDATAMSTAVEAKATAAEDAAILHLADADAAAARQSAERSSGCSSQAALTVSPSIAGPVVPPAPARRRSSLRNLITDITDAAEATAAPSSAAAGAAPPRHSSSTVSNSGASANSGAGHGRSVSSFAASVERTALSGGYRIHIVRPSRFASVRVTRSMYDDHEKRDYLAVTQAIVTLQQRAATNAP